MSDFFKRIGRLVIGIVLYSVGIVITMKAGLGYAPWDVFHQGIANTIGLTFGVVSIIVSLMIALLAVLLGEKLGIGTILNLILMGIFLDFILWLDFIPEMKGWISGAVMLIIGLIIIAFATFFYMGSRFGAGPRDSLMVALKRKTKLPVGVCRAFLEVSVVLIGWLLGGPVGAGTVVSAFGIGLCIQLVFSLMKFDPTSIKHETFDVTYKKLKDYFSGKK